MPKFLNSSASKNVQLQVCEVSQNHRFPCFEILNYAPIDQDMPAKLVMLFCVNKFALEQHQMFEKTYEHRGFSCTERDEVFNEFKSGNRVWEMNDAETYHKGSNMTFSKPCPMRNLDKGRIVCRTTACCPINGVKTHQRNEKNTKAW